MGMPPTSRIKEETYIQIGHFGKGRLPLTSTLGMSELIGIHTKQNIICSVENTDKEYI